MDNVDWSTELEESLIMAGSAKGVVNAPKDSYINPVQQVHKTDLLFSNAFPHWNSRSGPSSSWEIAISGGKTSDYRTSRPVTLNSNAQIGPILDYGISSNSMKPEISTNTGSFESLDCLLSASPSLTDTTTSVEDDGISLFFSDPKSVWNFSTMKSVPSFSSSSDITKPGKLIETISQTQEDHITRTRSRSSVSTDNHQPNPNKRKREGANDHNHPIKHQHLDFQSNNSSFQKKEKHLISSSNINFQQPSSSGSSADEPDAEAIAQMKEIIYRAAAFRPVNFGVEPVEKPRRKNVRISNDPQTVAARQRREKISERIRVLQTLVPGGSKMDTASMLDEAANYLKFLRSQVKALEALGPNVHPTVNNFPVTANLAFSPFVNYAFSMQQPQFSIHNPNPVNKS